MREKLVHKFQRATKAYHDAKDAMRAAHKAVKIHDVINSGYHNKIVKSSVYPNGIIVTDDMFFNDAGELRSMSGYVLRNDGKPSVRIGRMYVPFGRLEISDIPVMGRMYYNGEAVFDFAFTSGVTQDTFTFITTIGRYGSFTENRVAMDGKIINEVATWQYVTQA